MHLDIFGVAAEVQLFLNELSWLQPRHRLVASLDDLHSAGLRFFQNWGRFDEGIPLLPLIFVLYLLTKKSNQFWSHIKGYICNSLDCWLTDLMTVSSLCLGSKKKHALMHGISLSNTVPELFMCKDSLLFSSFFSYVLIISCFRNNCANSGALCTIINTLDVRERWSNSRTNFDLQI